MDTDHYYTLSLTLGVRESHEPALAESIKHFRIS